MDKKWNWAITGYQLVNKTNQEIIALGKHAGVASVEANASFVEGKSDRELVQVKEAYQDASLRLGSFHLPMGPTADISFFYNSQRNKAVEYLARLMEKAALLGSRVVILHPSTNRFPVEPEGMKRFLAAMGKSLDILLPKAEETGIMIALENMSPAEEGARLGSKPEHFTVFQEKFGHPRLGFCLDTGHAQISGGPGGPAAFLEAMSGQLTAFHLQDNAGDRDSHLAPGYGLVDWKTVFGWMKKINFRHDTCIEAPPFSYGPHLTHSPDAWKKMVHEMDALVTE